MSDTQIISKQEYSRVKSGFLEVKRQKT
jgi:hypothetical protein